MMTDHPSPWRYDHEEDVIIDADGLMLFHPLGPNMAERVVAAVNGQAGSEHFRAEGRAEVLAAVEALHAVKVIPAFVGFYHDGDELVAPHPERRVCMSDGHSWPCPTRDALADPAEALAARDQQVAERAWDEGRAEVCAAVKAVHGRYFDLEQTPGDEDTNPDPENVWRYDRDLRAVLADPAEANRQVAERAWDEGYARGTRDAEMDYEPADNPYRADRIAGAET